MSRIRTVKPELLKHEGLFDAEIESGLPLRLAFIGLFTAADREGRFEWRPRALKSDVLPFDDLDFEAVLDALLAHGFIGRYKGKDKVVGFFPSWCDHQHINQREAASRLPEPIDSKEEQSKEESMHVHAQKRTCTHVHARGEGKGKEGERKGSNTTSNTDQNQERARDRNRVPAGGQETWLLTLRERYGDDSVDYALLEAEARCSNPIGFRTYVLRTTERHYRERQTTNSDPFAHLTAGQRAKRKADATIARLAGEGVDCMHEPFVGNNGLTLRALMDG